MGFLALSGCGAEPPPPAPQTPEVSVAVPVAKEFADYEDFTGKTDAVSKVDIRARVSGYLIKVAFKDGDIVKKGDLLYEIDPRPFQADLDQAMGDVERLEAEKKLLVIQVDRYRKLAEKGAGSQQDLDQYLAQQAENVGGVEIGPGPGGTRQAESRLHADHRADHRKSQPHLSDGRQSGQRRRDAA